jgi:hypothetical protein
LDGGKLLRLHACADTGSPLKVKREERKLEKQLHKLNHQLSGEREAAKGLGHSAEREVVGAKKRVLSADSTQLIENKDVPEDSGLQARRP